MAVLYGIGYEITELKEILNELNLIDFFYSDLKEKILDLRSKLKETSSILGILICLKKYIKS